MFDLFPLISDHTKKIINNFKTEKSTLSKSIENYWESPIREIIFSKLF